MCVNWQLLKLNHCSITLILTFAGLAIAAQAEPRATAAGSGLVAVSQQTDVRAASSLPKLVHFTCMATYWTTRWKIKSQSHKYQYSIKLYIIHYCQCTAYLEADVSGDRHAALLLYPPSSLPGSLCC